MSRRSTALRASILALLLAAGATPVAADGDTLREQSASTFQLLPSQGIVRVTVDLTLTNLHRSSVSIVPCPSDPAARCRLTTSYYVNQWGYLWVPGTATSLKVTGASTHLESNSKGWRNYMLS